MGRDAEMKELTKGMCEDSYTEFKKNNTLTLPDPEDTESTQELLKLIMNVRNETRASAYKTVMSHYIRQGGSLVRSIALHVAIANNDASVAQCIIEMDPLTLAGRNQGNQTPLMTAAIVAAKSCNVEGYPRDPSIIDILIAAGADTSAIDSSGKTAYGCL